MAGLSILGLNSSPKPKEEEDTTLEFRKCWTLGEAFFYLSNYYIYPTLEELENQEYCKKEVDNCIEKLRIFYLTKLELMENICANLKIKPYEMVKIYKDIKQQCKKDFPCFIKDFEHFDRLEYLLTGNLVSLEPRYEDIFRTAKHCQILYIDDKVRRNPKKNIEISEKCKKGLYDFFNDLKTLSNFVSPNKRELITKLIKDEENWRNTLSKYDECIQIYKEDIGISNCITNVERNKILYEDFENYINVIEIIKRRVDSDYKGKNKNNQNPIDNPIAIYLKPPERVTIVFKIAGLILGSVKITDLLEKRDRTLINITIFGLIAVAIIVIYYIHINLNLVDLIANSLKSNPQIIAAALTTLLIPLIGFVIYSWNKGLEYLEYQFAKRRIQKPICHSNDNFLIRICR